MNRFEERLSAHGLALRHARLQKLQLNVGRKCNQACRHCHVDAGPWRTEMVGPSVARRIGQWIQRYRPVTVDLTGGAPELSEFFRFAPRRAEGESSKASAGDKRRPQPKPGSYGQLGPVDGHRRVSWDSWLQAPVNMAAAGDAVVVTNGTYAGSVSVTNALTLLNVNGPHVTVIEGGGPIGGPRQGDDQRRESGNSLRTLALLR